MGNKSPATTTQVNKTELSPEQQQLLGLALPFAQQYAGQPLGTYGGSTIAGFTPLEQQAQAGVAGASTGAVRDLANAGTAGQMQILNPSTIDVANNPYVNAQASAITNNMTDNLLQRVLPAIRTGATQAGGMYSGGGTREGVAQGLAIGQTNDAVGSALANLYGQAYNTGLSAVGQAVQRNPVAMASEVAPYEMMAGVGGQQRAMDQAQLDAAYKDWAVSQALPYTRATELIGLVNGIPGASGVSSVTGAQPQTNPLMGALGGASLGLTAASMIPGLNAFTIPLLLAGGAAGYMGTR